MFIVCTAVYKIDMRCADELLPLFSCRMYIPGAMSGSDRVCGVSADICRRMRRPLMSNSSMVISPCMSVSMQMKSCAGLGYMRV